MVTINEQYADLFLGHAEVNGGDPYRFLLWKRVKPIDRELKEEEGASISIQIEVNRDDDPVTMDKAFFFTVLLKDHSYFDGVRFTEIESRENLYELLGKGEGLFMQTSEGTYSALESDGFVVTETQYENYALAQVRLTAENAVFNPVPNDRFTASVWLEPDTENIFAKSAGALVSGLYRISPWCGVDPYLDNFRFESDSTNGNDPYLEHDVSVSTEHVMKFEIRNLDLSGLSILDEVVIATMNETSSEYVKIIIRYNGTAYLVSLYVLEDTGPTQTGFYVLQPAILQTIKFSIKFPSSFGANDGEAKLYIDDVLKETLSNLNIDLLDVNRITFGWVDLQGFSNTGNPLFIKDVWYAGNLAEVWDLEWDFDVSTSNQWGDGGTTQVNQGYWR